MAGLLSLCFHTPDGDFEMAHVASRKGSNVRSVECNHQRAAFGATHPVCAGMVEELQTISGPGKTTPDASRLAALPVGSNTLITRAASRNDNQAPSSAWTRTSSEVARPPVNADVRLWRHAWSVFGWVLELSHLQGRQRGCRRMTRPNRVATCRLR